MPGSPSPLSMHDHTQVGLRTRVLREFLRRALGPVGYERVQFRRHVGYWPNLRAPVRHQEKIAARKLFVEPPNASLLADKVWIRDYVAKTVGEKYLKEVLVIADRVEDIDFDALPDKFAAKTSHGSELNVIVQDKSAVDMAVVRERLARYLKTRFGRYTNEGWYARIPPRILIESFLEDTRYGVPPDINVLVFHGKARCYRILDKVSNAARDFYDLDWQPAGFYYADIPRGKPVPRPAHLDEMREVAEALAGDLDFVRVDFYSPDDKCVLFGELTLAPGAGWNQLRPLSADERIGSFWGAPTSSWP